MTRTKAERRCPLQTSKPHHREQYLTSTDLKPVIHDHSSPSKSDLSMPKPIVNEKTDRTWLVVEGQKSTPFPFPSLHANSNGRCRSVNAEIIREDLLNETSLEPVNLRSQGWDSANRPFYFLLCKGAELQRAVHRGDVIGSGRICTV
ncbi:hypothetical protein AVEN_256433-1 [Araneus ventricosus]|uniref:Uncharacterized protein n=1 Tax=Araneus ventricosus TaxID=182803 RepID=A0A4Y2K0H8_ARAVE|nr:hypothetical protein AVEN_256433-1 [Araneus ventricosus]